MQIRLLFLVALFVVSIFSGPVIRLAYADYCTVEEVLEYYYDGYPVERIEQICTELDVTECDVDEVYDMIDEGYSLSEIYGACS